MIPRHEGRQLLNLAVVVCVCVSSKSFTVPGATDRPVRIGSKTNSADGMNRQSVSCRDMKCGEMPLRPALHLPSVRDLLALVMSFSLLSLYLTYHLGFSAGRLHTADGNRQESLAYRDSHVDSPFRSPQLLDLLFKLERRQTWTGKLLAVIRGRQSLLQRSLRFYSSVLRSNGFSVRAEDTSLQNTSKTDRLTNWTLLLCFAFSDGEPECFSRTEFQDMRPLQRVNRIPGIQSVLWRRSGLCRTATQLSALPALFSRPITPACFALPEQYEEFLNVADAAGSNTSWLLKPSMPEENLEHISTMEFFNRVRLKEFPEKQELLVQQFLPNQLHILGFPVSFQLFVLVTSVAPLRAYLYGEGIVSFRYGEENGYRKIPGKWWLVSQLWQHVAATQGRDTVRMALENTDMLLVHLLLGAEAFLLVHFASFPDSQNRCENCYQLLAVELMYNSSFYPVVLGVSGQPSIGADSLNMTVPSPDSGSGRTQDSVRQFVLSDTLKLLFAKDSVHRSVFDSLQMAAEALNSGVTGLQCLISHDLCLTEDDLASLIASRREILNAGRFRRLYPTASGNRYSEYLQELQALMLQDSKNIFQPVNSLFRETLRHSTADLHGIQTRLEHAFNRGSSESLLDAEPEPGLEEDYSYPSDNLLLPSFDPRSEQTRKLVKEQENCSQDDTLLAYLKSLDLQPALSLDPPFTPLWTQYYVHVSYDITMVRVTANPLHCHVQTRFDHHLGPLRALNTTLGLGSNRIAIILQDPATGSTVNTYRLTLHRHKADYDEPNFNSNTAYAVCGLRQECEYRISPGEPCGLQQEEAPGVTSWPRTLQGLGRLPVCNGGDALGRWLLPCSSCSDRRSCIWSQMRWQPYHCSYRRLDRQRLATCLRGKKLLFVGDSTNRGMMHYIMQQLDGSLAACDKTHHIRVYSNLNQGHTTLSFAYYPQFWLAAPERPVFDKTLYQLLLKSQPLQNNSSTVVIVGGVHWLATQHLHTLMRVLRREDLQQARLVVKTLGSGFHIPAEGVHYLSTAQQKKLLRHSMGLAAFARHHHMDVVDTFNMTAARYKDFLQGKCACHFHKLTESHESGPGYHVEGPINAIYTEILLSLLCQEDTDL